jgi:hypothetical protein
MAGAGVVEGAAAPLLACPFGLAPSRASKYFRQRSGIDSGFSR